MAEKGKTNELGLRWRRFKLSKACVRYVETRLSNGFMMFLVVAASPASRCAWQKGSAQASSLRLLHGFPLFL